MGNVSGKDDDAASQDDDLDADAAEADDDFHRLSSVSSLSPPPPAYFSPAAPPFSPPASPAQSRSPRMFLPQTPVSPLLKPAHPISNHMLLNDQRDDSFDYPPLKQIPVLLVWTFGGSNVSVEGSWDHWKSRKSLQKSGKDFSILLALPSGVYRYRFVVDGERRCILDLPNITDESGHVVNLLDVHDYVPENTERVSEFDPPPSPTASYGWVMPDDKEMSKDPPVVPPQLPNGFIGSHHSDEEDFPRPQHIVLNHLFIERGLVAQPIVALGLTHRFRSKYVTVVLYKPVER